MLLGVLLVLGATVLGARLAAAADDSVEYWALASDVRAGDPVSADQLVATAVRLDDQTSAGYLAVADELPGRLADLEWANDATAGTLAVRDALVPAGRAAVRQVPLLVAEGSAPADLAPGDVVEVWVGPGPGDDGTVEAQRVLPSAQVLRSGGGASSLEGGGARTVLVEVPVDALTGAVVATVSAGHVTLVRQP